jgi:hypothetical protein
MRVTHNDGTVVEIGPGDAYVIEPGHNAEVLGDESSSASSSSRSRRGVRAHIAGTTVVAEAFSGARLSQPGSRSPIFLTSIVQERKPAHLTASDLRS